MTRSHHSWKSFFLSCLLTTVRKPHSILEVFLSQSYNPTKWTSSTTPPDNHGALPFQTAGPSPLSPTNTVKSCLSFVLLFDQPAIGLLYLRLNQELHSPQRSPLKATIPLLLSDRTGGLIASLIPQVISCHGPWARKRTQKRCAL
jgi:hypothetical protein